MVVMQNIGVQWIQHGELSVVAAGVAWVHARLVRMGRCMRNGVCVDWLTAYVSA